MLGKTPGQPGGFSMTSLGNQGRKTTCRTFLRDGATVTGDSAIAESFCDFFTGIGPALASKVRAPPGGSFASYLGPSSTATAGFVPTTPEEVESLCRALDISKGPGHDDFSPSVLCWISKEISTPLSGLINACLEVGFFPDFLKVARITPVFKSGDPTQFGNYRPISVLSVISKIFERVIQGRLLGFLKEQGHILNSQYGFRRGHSTYMAILDMVENIRKAWEDGEHCLGIFIDFKKAFDTVDHSILLGKLYHLGIRGLPLELIRSYFSNRRQYVVFNGAESSQQEITVGVPQGSILGPLFFLLYINDLSRVSSFFRCILFADDTNIFASAKTKRELYDRVGVELGKLSDWFAHNKLTLNYSKTEYIDFSKPAVELSGNNFFLKIDGNLIQKVNESKFLGVIIDRDLSWRGHIASVRSRLSQTTGIIGRARGFMNGAQLLLLYNTMVLPYLQYCLINWGNFDGDHNKGLRDGLLALQKTFVRIITGSHRFSHADPLFAKLGILKVVDLYNHSVRVFSFKLHKKLLPSGVSSMFDEISHTYNTRGAINNLFVSHSDSRSIKSIAPRVWNQLDQLDSKLKPDQKLKTSPSIASFKERSKRGLLGPYGAVCRVRACLSCAVSAPVAPLV